MKSIYLWTVPLYLFVGGLLLFPYIQKTSVNRNLPVVASIEVSPLFVKGTPYRITIPRLQIDLSVKNGDYFKESWMTSKDEALFATKSSLPNNLEGNTIIYGHNTNEVFYSTNRLIPGDRILLYTDNGIFEYEFTKWELVKPTDTTVFEYKGAPMLTLITCFGLTNSERRLMYFEYYGVTKK